LKTPNDLRIDCRQKGSDMCLAVAHRSVGASAPQSIGASRLPHEPTQDGRQNTPPFQGVTVARNAAK
jgi:hypothetical protein